MLGFSVGFDKCIIKEYTHARGNKVFVLPGLHPPEEHAQEYKPQG